MRTSHLILSALHFIIVAFLFLVGLFFLIASNDTYLCLLWHKFTEGASSCFLSIGAGLVLFSVLLGVSFFILYKKRFYQVKFAPYRAEVDKSVIHSYVSECMKEVIPLSSSFEVMILKDQSIQIAARLPSSHIDHHEVWLEEIEKRLSATFFHQLGYKKELIFTVVLD
jgi:hypothetical protein